ncbi:MAG: acetylglutamate kinase [Tenacibaculum sp.]
METVKIVKIGGKIIENTKALNSFLYDFSKLKAPKVLVHGGGNLLSELATELNISVQMINGRRITDAKTLNLVSMVYAGKINKSIVAQLQAYNTNALGFTGADGNTIISVKRPSKPIDYGFAGDVIKVNPQILTILIKNKVVPVFCALTHDKKGQLLNTNADTIAAELAIALTSCYTTELYYCFDKPGVLANISDNNSTIECITEKSYTWLKAQNNIVKGMLPKLDNCFYALNNKVFRVYVGNADMLSNSSVKYSSIRLK